MFTPLDLCFQRKRLKKGLTGFTLVELVMAIVIAAIVLTPTSMVVYESLRNTFLPEHFTIASSLLQGEMERVSNLRFDNIINQGPTSYTGDFSEYSYQVFFYYVEPSDLNTESSVPTDYKRVQVSVFHSGFPTVMAVTLVTNN